MNVWESVFSQSRANDGYYDEERLPEFRWDWPKNTWFQARLGHARENEPVWSLKAVRKSSASIEALDDCATETTLQLHAAA